MVKRRARKTGNEEHSPLYNLIEDRLTKTVGENTAADMAGDEFIASKVKEFIPSRCYALDCAMHLPGLPVGRVNAIRGDFMSGKSTLALSYAISAQEMGGFVVYIDTEYAFDERRSQVMGLDISQEKFMLVQLETVEDSVKTIRELISIAKDEQDTGNERLVFIIWDSVGATATKAELESDFGDSRPGIHARLISAALRQLTPGIAKYRICLLILNQEKDKVDFFSMGKDTKSMIAEKPIMFHSTVVLRPQHRMTITNSKKEPTGIRVICTVRKNKLAAPFSKAEFIINFRDGIDDNASKLSVAYQRGLVKKAGAWYSYSGEKFYERDFGKILTAHPEIMEGLEALRKKDQQSSAKNEDDADFEDEPEETIEDEEEEDDSEA